MPATQSKKPSPAAGVLFTCIAICGIAVASVVSGLWGTIIALVIATICLLLLTHADIRRSLTTLLPPLVLLSVYHITPTFTAINLLISGAVLALSFMLPRLILRSLNGDTKLFAITFLKKQQWSGRMWLYILTPAIIGYFSLPFYFAATGQYTHWQVSLEPLQLTLLFLSLVIVGVWDELFFIGTVLAVFRAHLPFWLANMLQATVFTTFLYVLGFGSWGIIVCYLFAVIQGYIYKTTESLLYAIAVHVTFDCVLFLVLVHAHYPHVFDIFLL